jgi:hypothetical protein
VTALPLPKYSNRAPLLSGVLLSAERAHGPPEFVAAKFDEPVLADRRKVASTRAAAAPVAVALSVSDVRREVARIE